jgi:PAS domain S-box-containing protein
MDQAEWCAVAMLAAGVIYLGLAAFVWSNRRVAGSYALIAMLVGVKVWALCYALELASTEVGDARVWAGLKYAGIVVLPPALWSFVWQYSGRGRLPRPALAALLVHPVAVLTILAVEQELLQDYDGSPAPITWVLGTSPSPAEGVLFVYHQAYTGVVMLSATVFLLWQLSRVAPPYRRQGRVLIVASVVPFVANVLWTTTASDRWHVVDPTPFLFLITAFVLVWGFFRLRLLNLLPVARGLVLEQMEDGVVVLDLFGRIVDVNPAASTLLGREKFLLVGRRATELLPALGPMLAGRGPDAPPDETEIVLRRPDRQPARTVSLSLSDVRDAAGRRSARLAVLHDVTEHRRTERRLRELLEEQTALAETLQQGLRPAQLPEIEGVRLAARAVPAAGRVSVSGDFYDVHPAGPDRSAFVLGDVSGKGVHAAIVTSMARYTVRTLSAQGWRPRQVLEQLNEALLAADDPEPERFCTVVYGHVERHLPPPAGPGGVRLTLALGGHPPPLLRRRDRTVQPVGTPGTALGLVPAVEIHEVHLDLAAGDVLLAYTDGVTEARRDSEQFGDERLAAVLAAVGAPPPRQAGAPQEEELQRGGVRVGVDLEVRVGADGGARGGPELAEEVAEGVLDAVQNYASSRDDVAVLVLAVL